MKKIYVSPSDQVSNAYAAGDTNEATQCRRIAKALCAALERCGFYVATDYSDGGGAMDARIRQSNEWGADLHVPVHTNAFNGTMQGTRVFCHDLSGEGYKASKAIFDRLAPVVPGTSDGVQTANFAEIRRTNCPCAYVEAAFHDEPQQAKWIIENVDAIAEAICQGICDYFGADYVPAQKALYRVQVGAFYNYDYALSYLEKVRAAGFPDAFITEG